MKALKAALQSIWRQTKLLGSLTRGLFEPGLASIARDIVAKQLDSNATARTFRHSRLTRVMRWWASSPMRSILIIVLIYAGVQLIGSLGWLSRINVTDVARLEFRDFWTVNIAVLGVQAALIGLVFPLVIAFVGLLNQGRAAFASRLTIYAESSMAVFVGVSSLLLCVAIALQLPFASRTEATGAITTMLNLAWFIGNVGALVYFVLRTIAFLHPARRAPIIRAYVANVVWPRELNETVIRNRWGNAVAYDYLPDGDQVDLFDRGGGARTWYSALAEFGEPRVSRRLRRKVRLVDVRLALLASVARTWLAEARAFDDGRVHDFGTPVDPGIDYEGEVVVARATLPLTPIARWGIRASFRFRRVREDHGSIDETATLFREMIADMIALIDARQADEFSSQLSELIEFHAFLYKLAQLDDEDINYGQMSSGWGLAGGRSLSESWSQAYRDMIRRAVERLPDEPEFFGRVAYLGANVYGRAGREVTPKALTSVLRLADFVSYRLMEWAVDQSRAENAGASSPRAGFSLLRLGDTYAGAWRDMVAGWERLLHVVVSVPGQRGNRERSWAELGRIAVNVLDHLDSTTRLAARAIWSGDRLATNWTCDLLLHWKAQAEHGWESRGAYWLLRSEALTLDGLELDWQQMSEGLAPPIDGREITAPVVFGAIIHNAWRDHVVTLASVAIHWAMHDTVPDTVLQAARMLLRNEPHDRGDVGHRDEQPMSAADILISSLRITGSGERFAERSYAATFEHLLESLGRLGERPWVSLRIYSSSGGFSFEALPIAHALAMVAAASGSQGITADLRRLLNDADDEALRRRQRYLSTLRDAFAAIDTDRGRAVAGALVDAADALSFEARLDNARLLVEQALALLVGRRDQAIADAQIDPDRMRALAVAAGSEAFVPDEFPLNLFSEIVATPDELTEFTLKVSNANKGAYTAPLMEQLVVNEEDWWREAIARQVAAVVWHDVLNAASFDDVEGRTPEEFWHAVRDASARIREAGDAPVLVIASTSHPEWLLDWQWSHRPDPAPKPADLVITRLAEQAEGYEFSMNDTPVYRAQTAYGVAYLVPEQLFRRLRYRDYGDGLSVAMRFDPDSQNPWRGTMMASFARETEVADAHGYRIRFDSDPRPDLVEPGADTSPPPPRESSRPGREGSAKASPARRRRNPRPIRAEDAE